jgi:hypothetical protein
VNINDGLMFKGAYNGKSIGDILAFGDWLDYHNIPVLNPTMISVTQVEDYFYKMLLSFSINFAWRQQNVYLVSYPMTEDECMFFSLSRGLLILILIVTVNNLAVAAGSNDFRLKHYYGGRGFYFQG